MLNRFRAFVGLCVFALVFTAFGEHRAQAAPLAPAAVPDPLKPWIHWAEGEKLFCSSLYGLADQSICAWPSRLTLTLDDHGGHFVQTWHVEARSWIPLVGDAKRWPFDVKIDGARAVVLQRGDGPQVEVPVGDHKIEGSLLWDTMPESIHVPPETGLLSLNVRNADVAFPNRDASGQVFLAKIEAAEEGERLEIVVHRKIDDGVPIYANTHVVLNVAGKNREVVLGKSLLEGFIPTSLVSPLPARVEPDGHLRVQVRPGRFVIELTARSEKSLTEIKRPEPAGPWRDGEEVWVFQANPLVRAVSIEGVAAIDPQQTSLPEEWKKLPAYPVRTSDVFKLTERRRGDADAPPDRLSLNRAMWLDFDGHSFTVSDNISGSLERSARLEMETPTVLGRVAIGGRDQFITRLSGKDGVVRSGVEVREGALHVNADSRIASDPTNIPAVGWDHDFHEVSALLHLPPGFRLLYASGVDDVPNTWIKHWTLLELFLALVLSLAIFRLRGPIWGVVALVTFALTFPEGDAPKWIWVAVVALEAITRALPEGKVRKVFSWLRIASVALVVLICVPFLVTHVRQGMYPAQRADSSLDTSEAFSSRGDTLTREQTTTPNAASAVAKEPNPPTGTTVDTPAKPQLKLEEKPVGGKNDRFGGDGDRDESINRFDKLTDTDQERSDVTKTAPAQDAQGYAQSQTIDAKKKNGKYGWGPQQRVDNNNEVYDPKATVQTGPGIPSWHWTDVPLRWSGPVERTQRIHLYLLNPAENLVLAFVRMALLGLLLYRFTRAIRPKNSGGKGSLLAGSVAAILLISIFAPRTAHADIPTKDLLDELGRRLNEKPECLPMCASADRMILDAQKKTLRIRFEVSAVALTAVPLPGDASQWTPATVLVDGQPAKSLARTSDGKLWVSIAAGPHQVQLEGALPERDSVQLALQMHPHRVESTLDGWTLAGVHEDGLSDDNLQLTRKQDSSATGTLAPGALPPFVLIERTIHISLNWQVETRIVRATPPGIAIVLEVPLLQGESVTTADIRVVAGKAQVNMAPTATEVNWSSALAEKSPINLSAPKTSSWVEVWRLDASPIWHTIAKGIPPVEGGHGAPMPEWRPWPGETETIEITRPEGIPGNTFTIDQSSLEVKPGLRTTDCVLTLSIRSSRGAEHTINLPAGADLEQVMLNGVLSPIRQEGRKVTLPLSPGSQSVRLQFRTTDGIALSYRAPTIDLGSPSVNATTVVSVSDARWVLFVSGPRLGPAVLFWSHLLVLFAVAIALSRIRFSGVRVFEWILLAVGLSQISVTAGAFVVGWLLLLGWRKEKSELSRKWLFNARQLVIAAATLIALGVLLEALHQGLLGQPDMQVSGNGSCSTSMHWFQDRTSGTPDAPWILSVPLLAYRLVMLAWALWLALTVLRWLRRGFSSFGEGGMWRKSPPRAPSATPLTAAPLTPAPVPAPPMPNAPPHLDHE